MVPGLGGRRDNDPTRQGNGPRPHVKEMSPRVNHGARNGPREVLNEPTRQAIEPGSHVKEMSLHVKQMSPVHTSRK